MITLCSLVPSDRSFSDSIIFLFYTMLPSANLSKVYGHGHIKKIWLMQNQKESESKALVGSSAASPSRLGSSSAGLCHESKQGAQFCLGHVASKSFSSPAGVSVWSSVSGPACSNMSLVRHVSLATCAESLSPPSRSDQLCSFLPPSSPSGYASISEEDKSLAEGNDDHGLVNSPCRGSASTSRCNSPFALGNHIAGDALCSYMSPSNDVFGSSNHDQFFFQQDDLHLQERFDHVEACNSCEQRNFGVEPGRCSVEIFSNVDSRTPFAIPFKLPENYLAEREGPVNKKLDWSYQGKSRPFSRSTLLDGEPARRELSGTATLKPYEASEEVHSVGVSGLRTCTVCGTSKTPLWRSGPQGPKSLCNACGIRFKKAKRSSCEGSAAPLPSQQFAKNLLKPSKRKQDMFAGISEAHAVRPLVIGSVMPCAASQVAKKRRWSRLIKKGEYYAQKCEVTGSSGESSLTWSSRSPVAVSSPSVTQFERLSIDESAAALDMVAGKDEEEAALLLMYMSCGRDFS